MTIQEAATAQLRREQLQRDINLYKVEKIDRSIYTKTEQEVAKLYKLKTEWNAKIKAGYHINKALLAGSYTALADNA